MISQLTVFIENQRGHLAKVCRTIADANINMKALFLADTEDFGVARIFCDRPKTAEQTLLEAGYRAKLVPVLGVRVPDREGGLAELLEFLDDNDVDVEYGYCFSVNENTAFDVLKVSDPSVETKLSAAGYTLAEDGEIHDLD